MYCKKCGSLMNDSAGFCPNCGQTAPVKAAAPSGEGYVPQQPVSQPQPGYGGYSQAPRQPVYGQHQVGGQPVTGYPYPPAKQSSALKTFLILFMAAALILSITGLLSFSVTGQKIGKGSGISIKLDQGNTMTYFIYAIDEEGFADTIEAMFEDDVLIAICFFGMLAAMAAAGIFAVIGLICLITGNHSGGAATFGIGFIIAAMGYIMNLIYAIKYVDEANSGGFDRYAISSAPIIMTIVCISLAVMSFTVGGKLRRIE